MLENLRLSFLMRGLSGRILCYWLREVLDELYYSGISLEIWRGLI